MHSTFENQYEVVIEGSGMFGEEQNKQVPMASFLKIQTHALCWEEKKRI